ncbi:tetratricopeptide repeat-containing serine protease family protein [Crocosphaera sp. XPORK-15E]|uniref:tetratricopeptide repeat-containing S1 family peptidase n=1 Tax=Crocosphaera sp. XPORK-15E TaxID=3110247 RepID=UPI002B2164C2|nr:trypsin-like peptidase domain-containing protein [Crocosphaera sp. XPORK-15E]MEA5534145.1 trypsin-like peptidase domain-containing protein [Crocosphaera sp. XPORK-15E]
MTVRVYTGDTNGSGVLIGQTGETYTVITNAHVVKRGEPYRIQTPDGITHNATLKTAEDSLTGNDLALLQFNSTNSYSLATFAATDPLKPNQAVYAAGFPYDSPQLSISEGNVTLITPKPITGGYQIGFSNPTKQGMSGGVLLNEKGELVGILGKGNAILTDAYNYQDGTRPDATLLKQMQQSYFAIPIEPVAFLAKLYSEEATNTQIPRQVNQIAEKITVRIERPDPNDGSGVIIGRNGQTYYVLTAGHVVEGITDFKIITPDGKSHVPKKDGIKTFEGVDIGVVEFTSPETYQVATLADYTVGGFKTNKIDIDIQKPLIFLSGFPLVKSGNPSRKFTIGVASPEYINLMATNDRYSLSTGMELIYNALSLPGMSGGAVLDHQGRVIGINAGAEYAVIGQGEEAEELYFGNSLGVPIKTFLGQLQKGNLNPQWFKIETKAPETLSKEQINQIRLGFFTQKTPTASSSAVEWFHYGQFLARLEQYDQAIAAYNQAIQGNPQFYQAYYLKGVALKWREKYPEALAALEKVIEIDPKIYLAWYEKARILRYELQKYPESLTALDKALELQPQEAKLYGLRGTILGDLERDPEAEEAYTEAIKLKPNADSYLGRAFARQEWGDYEGAIADATKAIELQPNYSLGYTTRAMNYWQQGIDISAALKDINTAIQLDPDFLVNYFSRGLILSQINDHQGAIADLTKIINNGREFDPDMLKQTYFMRASNYSTLKEWNKAIADFTKIIELDPNNAEHYFVRGLYRHLEGKDLQGALADLTKAIALKPDSANAYHLRAEVYGNQLKDAEKAKLDYKKAEELFTQNIQKVPNDPLNYSFRGGVRRSLGNTQGAEEDYKKAKELLAQDKSLAIEGFETIQNFRAKQKRMQAYYTQEISKAPQNFKLYFYRAIVTHELRDYQTALDDFNRSIELNSN